MVVESLFIFHKLKQTKISSQREVRICTKVTKATYSHFVWSKEMYFKKLYDEQNRGEKSHKNVDGNFKFRVQISEQVNMIGRRTDLPKR